MLKKTSFVIWIGILSSAWPLWYIIAALIYRHRFGDNTVSLLFILSGGLSFLLWVTIFSKLIMKRLDKIEVAGLSNHLLKIIAGSIVVLLISMLLFTQYKLLVMLL